jgi:DNA repair protein RadC
MKLSIKKLAVEDRPREKMLLKGVASLSDAELMAILISSGNNEETAVQLSQRILNCANNNLNTVGKLSVKELMVFKGIGEAKAITISAAMELGRRKSLTEPETRFKIGSSHDAFKIFYPHLCDLQHEELWVALTSRSSRVIEKVKISQGGTGETPADLRLILKAAINSTCHGIIMCHNHPSGSTQPSPQDDLLTSRLIKAAELMGVKLLDHIIICDQYYFSYADEGRIFNS